MTCERCGAVDRGDGAGAMAFAVGAICGVLLGGVGVWWSLTFGVGRW